MSDEIRALRPRAWVALAVILALGLLCAVSAFARPLHPAFEQAEGSGKQAAPSTEQGPAPDPRC